MGGTHSSNDAGETEVVSVGNGEALAVVPIYKSAVQSAAAARAVRVRLVRWMGASMEQGWHSGEVA